MDDFDVIELRNLNPDEVNFIDFKGKQYNEVRHGKWLSTWHKDKVVCSNCHKYLVLATDVYDYNYCPNCGAKMEKE